MNLEFAENACSMLTIPLSTSYATCITAEAHMGRKAFVNRRNEEMRSIMQSKWIVTEAIHSLKYSYTPSQMHILMRVNCDFQHLLCMIVDYFTFHAR